MGTDNYVEGLRDMGNSVGTKAIENRIDVILVEMSGVQYRLQTSLQASVAELKDIAAPVLQVPSEFQRLFVGERLLDDRELLCNHLQSGSHELHISFAFSVGDALLHESMAVRRAAIDSLAKVARAGRRQAVAVLLDENEICRQAAVSALGDLVQFADGYFLTALVSRLMDSNSLIAVSAVQSLAKAADFGNEEAISTLLQFVEVAEDQEVMVQLAVIEACLKLPRKHDQRIIRSLQNIVYTSGHARVCSVARRTYAKVAQRRRARVSCTL
eukprot:CAMPEP_0169209262 /NCGR_PEP_ID=MMETSP1016-20121227/14576_1 /TAXON_ID=342587 /ORGANISM="Karlodinium micrum, Strain CCMP2283" /LENGTH=270 /DNA_ID=CAMNT_0009286701 /DNA_START=34 /DNA_END=846 /DNA_ORIENTATION=+